MGWDEDEIFFVPEIIHLICSYILTIIYIIYRFHNLLIMYASHIFKAIIFFKYSILGNDNVFPSHFI